MSDEAVGGSRTRHVARVARLRAGARPSYERLHAAVWPTLERELRTAHISNYSIFVHEDLLVSVFDYSGDDLDRDLDALGRTAVATDWEELTRPLVTAVDAGSDVWQAMRPVYHLTDG